MVEKSMGAALRFFEKVGHRINNAVQRLGFAARFFVMVLVYSGQSFRRFHLTIRNGQLIKTGFFCVADPRPKINFPDPRPMDGRKTHRTRFARRVDDTALQLERAQVGTGVADRYHLGVSRRIIGRGDPIVAFADDPAVLNDDTAERAAVVRLHSEPSEFDRAKHKFPVLLVHYCLGPVSFIS